MSLVSSYSQKHNTFLTNFYQTKLISAPATLTYLKFPNQLDLAHANETSDLSGAPLTLMSNEVMF